jgi:hypothetical protein
MSNPARLWRDIEARINEIPNAINKHFEDQERMLREAFGEPDPPSNGELPPNTIGPVSQNDVWAFFRGTKGSAPGRALQKLKDDGSIVDFRPMGRKFSVTLKASEVEPFREHLTARKTQDKRGKHPRTRKNA